MRLRFDFKKSEDGTVLNDGIRYELEKNDWLVDASRYSDAEINNDFETTPQHGELDYAVLRLECARMESGCADQRHPRLVGKERHTA